MSDYRDASVEIGANEFHKKTGIAAAQRQTESEFKNKYVDSKTGKIQKHLITKRNCPVQRHGCINYHAQNLFNCLKAPPANKQQI